MVVGLDRRLTYAKLSTAMRAVRNGARLIGSNPDRTFPSETGLKPGAGATLAALEAATDVAPVVIGKPETAILEMALTRLGAAPQTTAIIGDALYKDDAGGQKGGLFTIPAAKRRHRGCQLTESAPDRVWCNADISPCTVPAGLSQARQPTLARAPRQGLTNHNHAEKLLLTRIPR